MSLTPQIEPGSLELAWASWKHVPQDDTHSSDGKQASKRILRGEFQVPGGILPNFSLGDVGLLVSAPNFRVDDIKCECLC